MYSLGRGKDAFEKMEGDRKWENVLKILIDSWKYFSCGKALAYRHTFHFKVKLITEAEVFLLLLNHYYPHVYVGTCEPLS